MKIINYLLLSAILFNGTTTSAQKNTSKSISMDFPISKFTIEPGIGINPAPMSDFVVSNLIQWNVTKRFSLSSHSSLNLNGPFNHTFNYVETNYNYSLIQKFGPGASLYTRRSSHTFSLLAGIKYSAYKETLNNPEFEKISVKVHTVSPDFGFMYSLKLGQKKVFFSYRMYIPLYPYPVKKPDYLTLDSNLANISLELGVGIRLK